MDVNVWLPIVTLFLGYGLSAFRVSIVRIRPHDREVPMWDVV